MKTRQQFRTFCRNIRWLRQKAGLNQTQMAKLLRISVRSLTMLENETVPPHMDIEVLFRAGALFEVAPGALFEPLGDWDR